MATVNCKSWPEQLNVNELIEQDTQRGILLKPMPIFLNT